MAGVGGTSVPPWAVPAPSMTWLVRIQPKSSEAPAPMPRKGPRCRLFRAFVGCGFCLLAWEEGFSWLKYTQPARSGIGYTKLKMKSDPQIAGWGQYCLFSFLFFNCITPYLAFYKFSMQRGHLSCGSSKDDGHSASTTRQLQEGWRSSEMNQGDKGL